jgi:hypothetical protein
MGASVQRHAIQMGSAENPVFTGVKMNDYSFLLSRVSGALSRGIRRY